MFDCFGGINKKPKKELIQNKGTEILEVRQEKGAATFGMMAFGMKAFGMTTFGMTAFGMTAFGMTAFGMTAFGMTGPIVTPVDHFYCHTECH